MPFPIKDGADALRGKVRTAWSIPTRTPIPRTGEDAVKPSGRYPFAILQRDGEAPVESGIPLKDRVVKPRFLCWLYKKKVPGTSQTEAMEDDLNLLVDSIYSDPTFGGKVQDSEIYTFDETGSGRPAPIDADIASGLSGGFVGVELVVNAQLP